MITFFRGALIRILSLLCSWIAALLDCMFSRWYCEFQQKLEVTLREFTPSEKNLERFAIESALIQLPMPGIITLCHQLRM